MNPRPISPQSLNQKPMSLIQKLLSCSELPPNSAIALMHLGYSLDNCVDMLDKDRYGDYDNYLANVKELLEKVKCFDNRKVWYFLEKKNRKKKNKNRLALPEDRFIVYTDNQGGNVEGAQFGSAEYTREGFYKLLTELGIEQVFVGGEWAYFNYKPESYNLELIGCLGEMVRIFTTLKGISVTPINGCVYPLKPPVRDSKVLNGIYIERDRKCLDCLY